MYINNGGKKLQAELAESQKCYCDFALAENLVSERKKEVSEICFWSMRKNSPTYFNSVEILRNKELIDICKKAIRHDENIIYFVNPVIKEMRAYLSPMYNALSEENDNNVMQENFPSDIEELMRPLSAIQVRKSTEAIMKCVERNFRGAFWDLYACICDGGYAAGRNKIISINECCVYINILDLMIQSIVKDA